MPSAVANVAVTGSPLGADSDAVNVIGVVPALPSTTLTLSIDRSGALSSSVIVPVAVPTPIVALVGVASASKNVSLASSSASFRTGTVTVAVVSPGAKLAVPVVAV